MEYFELTSWWLENPRRVFLKSCLYMEGIPYVDADNCQYSEWGYQKPTQIWSDTITIAGAVLPAAVDCPSAASGIGGVRLPLKPVVRGPVNRAMPGKPRAGDTLSELPVALDGHAGDSSDPPGRFARKRLRAAPWRAHP